MTSAEQFSAFLLRRHHLHPEHRLVGPPGVLASLELLQGEDLPVRVWEQDLLPARVESYEREWLDRLGLAGEMVWTVFDRAPGERAHATRVGAALRENIGWLREASPTPEMDARIKNVLLHLQLRGASFAQELARATGLSTPDALAALWQLFRAGLVTPIIVRTTFHVSPGPSTTISMAGDRVMNSTSSPKNGLSLCSS